MNVVDKENFWTCFECEFTEHADGRVEPGKFKRWALQPNESKEAFEALCKKTYVDSHSLMDGTTLTIEHVSKDPKIKAHFYEHIDKAVKFCKSPLRQHVWSMQRMYQSMDGRYMEEGVVKIYGDPQKLASKV